MSVMGRGSLLEHVGIKMDSASFVYKSHGPKPLDGVDISAWVS